MAAFQYSHSELDGSAPSFSWTISLASRSRPVSISWRISPWAPVNTEVAQIVTNRRKGQVLQVIRGGEAEREVRRPEAPALPC